MRKLFVAVAALGMLLTSCAKDDVQSGGNGAVVSFNIAQPTIASRVLGTEDATQAYGTGYTVEDLQYAIFEAEVDPATGDYSIRDNGQKPISGVVDGFFENILLKNTLDNIRLVRGKHYIALFFAQADAKDGHWNVNWDDQSIELKDVAELKAQDETMDAFFKRVDFKVDPVASTQTFDAVLTRPFAQVNVLTDDAVEAQLAGLDVYQTSITVEGVYTKMNLLDGEVENETSLTFGMAEKGNMFMKVNTTDYDLLSMNYLLVNEYKLVDITFNYNEDATVAGNDNTVFEAEFDAVPVQRNYRTNIMGPILTSAVRFIIEINPIFAGSHGYNTEKSPEEMLVEAAAAGGEYILGADVELSQTLVVEKDFTLNLNGKTLTNSVVMRSAAPTTDVIIVAAGATLTIEGDGVVEAVSGNDGYAVIAEGKVIIKGGTYKAGVDQDGAANAVIYARGEGKVYVEGGYFPNDANSGFVLNKKDADRDNTTIEVKGGKFVNFNPANNAAETAGTNFMAKGYTVEAAEVDGKTVYTVVEIEVTPLATPVVETAVEGNVITLTWKAVEGAAKYSVQVDDDVVEFVEATSYEFTGDWEVEYQFSVKAIAADTEWHTDSAAAEVKATTEAKPADEPEEPVYTTVAEFLALSGDDVVPEDATAEDIAAAPLYTLKGTITSVTQTTYGNFYLNDGTGEVLIYGLCSPEGAQKYWAESGAKVGDDIVVKTIRTEYNGSPQGKNALFVELLPGTLAFWSFETTATSFTAAGGEKEIGLDIYNATAEVVTTSDNEQFSASYADGVLTIVAKENTSTEEGIEGNIAVTCGNLSQVITVSQAKASASGEDKEAVDATLSFADKANRTVFTTSQQVWEQNNIKLINDKGSSTSNIADYANPARFYKSTKITVSAPGNITSIVFDCNSASYATDLNKSSLPGTVSVSSDKVTVVLDGSSNEYVISSLTGGQVRLDSITVTYLQ